MKYYAVKVGKITGVFDNWNECNSSVTGFPGAIYKSFKTKEEAEAFLNGDIIIKEGAERASKTKNKFYAVKSGTSTGVFNSWDECQIAIKGFSNPDYKAFYTREEADAYLTGIDLFEEEIREVIKSGRIVAFCDGSYDKDQKRYSYGVLVIDLNLTEHEICGYASNEKYLQYNNIMGEILGVVNALDWAVSNLYPSIRIYHDYEGLSKWITGEWSIKSDIAKMYVSLYKAKFEGIIDLEFRKVKGHSNNKYNNKADELATLALQKHSWAPIKGDNWFTIKYFKQEDLQSIIELLKSEHDGINFNMEDSSSRIIYRLQYNKHKLTMTLFKTGERKLLIQGAADSLLFQMLTTTINELLGLDVDQVFGNAYRTKIDKQKIDNGYNDLFINLPSNYPNNIKRLIRQAIINLNYFVDCVDFSQCAFPALKALEGHIKYLFNREGISINSKIGFDCFVKNGSMYRLSPDVSISDPERSFIEECYNFYCSSRHTLFHYGDIIGSTDSTRIIESKHEADEIIKKCFALLSRVQ